MSTPSGTSYFGVEPTHLATGMNTGAQSFNLTQMGAQAQQFHTFSQTLPPAWLNNAAPEQLQALSDQVYHFHSSVMEHYTINGVSSQPAPSAVVYTTPFPYNGHPAPAGTPVVPPRADQTSNDAHTQASGFEWFRSQATAQLNSMVETVGGGKSDQILKDILTGGAVSGIGIGGGAALGATASATGATAAVTADATASGAGADIEMQEMGSGIDAESGMVIDDSAVAAGDAAGDSALELGFEEAADVAIEVLTAEAMVEVGAAAVVAV